MKFFSMVSFFVLTTFSLSLKAEDVIVHIEKALKEQQRIAQEIGNINENCIQRRGQSKPEIEYAIQAGLSATAVGLLQAWGKRPTNTIEAVKLVCSLVLLGIGGRALWNLFVEWSHSAGEQEQIRELLKQNTTRAEIIEYLRTSHESVMDSQKTEDNTVFVSGDTLPSGSENEDPDFTSPEEPSA